jgi:hypothetical protein
VETSIPTRNIQPQWQATFQIYIVYSLALKLGRASQGFITDVIHLFTLLLFKRKKERMKERRKRKERKKER